MKSNNINKLMCVLLVIVLAIIVIKCFIMNKSKETFNDYKEKELSDFEAACYLKNNPIVLNALIKPVDSFFPGLILNNKGDYPSGGYDQGEAEEAFHVKQNKEYNKGRLLLEKAKYHWQTRLILDKTKKPSECTVLGNVCHPWSTIKSPFTCLTNEEVDCYLEKDKDKMDKYIPPFYVKTPNTYFYLPTEPNEKPREKYYFYEEGVEADKGYMRVGKDDSRGSAKPWEGVEKAEKRCNDAGTECIGFTHDKRKTNNTYNLNRRLNAGDRGRRKRGKGVFSFLTPFDYYENSPQAYNDKTTTDMNKANAHWKYYSIGKGCNNPDNSECEYSSTNTIQNDINSPFTCHGGDINREKYYVYHIPGIAAGGIQKFKWLNRKDWSNTSVYSAQEFNNKFVKKGALGGEDMMKFKDAQFNEIVSIENHDSLYIKDHYTIKQRKFLDQQNKIKELDQKVDLSKLNTKAMATSKNMYVTKSYFDNNEFNATTKAL